MIVAFDAKFNFDIEFRANHVRQSHIKDIKITMGLVYSGHLIMSDTTILEDNRQMTMQDAC